MRRSKGERGDRALLEGPHLVGEALACGVLLEDILATPEFLADPAYQELLAALPHPPRPVAAAALATLADADSPRGLVALARLPRRGVEDLPLAPAGVYLYAEGLQDPGNLGALARSAEAAGAAGLALSPGAALPNHPRALRASAGSLLRLPVAVDVEPQSLAEHLAAIGPRWIALRPSGGADLYAADLRPPCVLLLGAEGPGLSPALLARADQQVSIPLAPGVESLNAPVAAALALFEIRRRQRS